MKSNDEDLERIREEGLKALKEKLGVEDTMKFIQMFSSNKGNYTKEREKMLKDITIEEFEKYVLENKKI